MSAALDSIVSDSDREVSAVLFDWGGTLAAYLGEIPQQALFTAAHDVLPQRYCEQFAESIAVRVKRSWSQGTTVSDTIESLSAASASEVGLDVEDSCRFVDQYLKILAQDVHHVGAVKEVLKQINNRGLATAMVCNTLWPANWHDRLLERDGLLTLLRVRTYSSCTHIRKPNPEAFKYAARQLDVDTRSCIFVGDRGDEDIDGAASVGMATVWVRNHYSPPHLRRPDHIVASISNLLSR